MGSGEGSPKHPQRLSATGKGESNRLEMYAEIGDIGREGGDVDGVNYRVADFRMKTIWLLR